MLGLLFSRTFFLAQTDVAEIVEGGTEYIMVCKVITDPMEAMMMEGTPTE